MWIYSNNPDQAIWLAENYKWAWHVTLSSRTRVKSYPDEGRGLQTPLCNELNPHPSHPPSPQGSIKRAVQSTYTVAVVRLSLLTMTNPNQLCDVLLFVCSKMADETNLSSKLPVADRTRKVWGRNLCWWCLSSGFQLCTFLLGFADSFCFVFTSSPFYEAPPLCTILCNLFPWLCWYVEVLREALWVSLYHFFCPPWSSSLPTRAVLRSGLQN